MDYEDEEEIEEGEDVEYHEMRCANCDNPDARATTVDGEIILIACGDCGYTEDRT